MSSYMLYACGVVVYIFQVFLANFEEVSRWSDACRTSGFKTRSFGLKEIIFGENMRRSRARSTGVDSVAVHKFNGKHLENFLSQKDHQHRTSRPVDWYQSGRLVHIWQQQSHLFVRLLFASSFLHSLSCVIQPSSPVHLHPHDEGGCLLDHLSNDDGCKWRSLLFWL